MKPEEKSGPTNEFSKGTMSKIFPKAQTTKCGDPCAGQLQCVCPAVPGMTDERGDPRDIN